MFKLLCKKQNKTKSSLPYILWKVGPLPDSWFPLGVGREAKAGAMSLAASEGVRSRSVKRPGSCKALGHLTVCFLGTSVGLGGSFIALTT